MKKAKAKPKARGQKRKPARKSGTRNVDIVAVRQQVTNIIGAEAETMVWAAVEEGQKGHYQAMKYLFELAGIFPAPVNEEKNGEATSYAEILCRELGLPEEPAAEPPSTAVVAETAAAQEHAVESGSGS